MPENLLTDAMRRLLTENTESTSQPELCCASAAGVALTGQELRLLVDLCAVLPERTSEGLRITRIASESLLRLLEALPGSPWRGLSAHKLGQTLGKFGVHPRAIRFRSRGRVLRGYECDELRSVFLMFVPTATSQA